MRRQAWDHVRLPLAFTLALAACGGTDGSTETSTPTDEPTQETEPTAEEGASPPGEPPIHEAMARALSTSTAPLAEMADESCRGLATDPGPTTLADLVDGMPDSAAEQHTSCDPRAEGGFHCRTTFVEDDDEGSTAVFEYDVDEGHAISMSSLTCMFAG